MPDVIEPTRSEPSTAATTSTKVGSWAPSRITSARRWLRNVLTQEKVSDALKTLAWVAPLTLLIWVYAEREQIYRTPDPFPIPIEVKSADPTQVVALLRPTEPVVMAHLEGPRSQIDALRDEFTRDGGTAVEITVEKRSNGTHELQVATLLNNNWRLVQRNVRVTSAQPPYLQISVDTYEEVELPVVAPASVTNLVDVPKFTPPRVKVRAPSDQIQRARESGELQAVAEIGQHETPGAYELPSVRVSVPGLQENVAITPGTVKANLEVRQANRQYKIPYVVVYPVGAANLLKQFRIEATESIPNVTVVGPPDKIALIERGEFTPEAILKFSREDADGTTRRRRLQFNLPEGVTVSPEDAQREGELRLVPLPPDQ
jgi:hypothetical protein